MSPILLMTLIVIAVFACAFGLCEWIARGGGSRDSMTSPAFPRDGEEPRPAAKRRVARQLEQEDGAGAE